ncbi:MAG: choice-of-anchor E domain-containing protein [Phycisphaerales bacterium]
MVSLRQGFSGWNGNLIAATVQPNFLATAHHTAAACARSGALQGSRLTASFATLIVPAAASAEVVTVGDSVSNLATSPFFQTAEGGQYDFAAWTPTLNLAQFDPSLGQLVGITVTIQTGLTNHLLLTGYTPQHLPQAYGACSFQLDWTCSISAPGAMVILPDSRSGSGTLSGMLGYSQTSVFAAAPLLLGGLVARRRRR